MNRLDSNNNFVAIESPEFTLSIGARINNVRFFLECICIVFEKLENVQANAQYENRGHIMGLCGNAVYWLPS